MLSVETTRLILNSVISGVFGRTGDDVPVVHQILASLCSIVERLGSSSPESIERV